MTAVVVGLGVAVGLLALLVAGLLRAHSEVLRKVERIEVSLRDLSGSGSGGGDPGGEHG